MKAVGIILAGGNNDRMAGLSPKRAVAALPLAGGYRAIDFALSNMANSNVGTVAVITQYSTRSLSAHLSSSKWWDFGRKQGGLFLLNPTITPDNTSWYRGTADALIQNLDFLKERHEPYVIIASGDGVYKIDYNTVLDWHVKNRAEITVVCKEMPKAESGRFGVLETDAEGRITAWHEKESRVKGNYVNCGIYVIRRRHLINFLESCKLQERYDFVRDVLVRNLEKSRIMAYVHEGYWTNVNEVKAYFDCNMALLDPELRQEFFCKDPVIKTKLDDYPPVKLNSRAEVKNSLVGGGSIVNGCVEDSVLFKKVFVGEGSKLKNCIVLEDAYIGENVSLENCIVEVHTKVEAGTCAAGTRKNIVVLSCMN